MDGLRAWARGWWRRGLAAAVLIAIAATLVVLALRSPGTEATNVQLDDGTVWVTYRGLQSTGRLNVRIDELDFSIGSDNRRVDVLQETFSFGGNVQRVVLFGGESGVRTVNAKTGNVSAADNSIPISLYRIGGGVGAVLDPESGRLWTGPSTQIVAPTYPEEPETLVAPGSRFVVTRESPPPVDPDEPDRSQLGSVVIVDATGWYRVALDRDLDPLVAIDTDGDEDTDGGAPQAELASTDDEDEEFLPDPYVPDSVTPLGVDISRIAEVSAVGVDPLVLLDDGTVVLADGRRASIPGEQHRVQQPGLANSFAVVASDAGLFAVDLETALVTELTSVDDSLRTPAAPIVVGACTYSAWNGDAPSFVRVCGESTTGVREIGDGVRSDAELVWRVNQRTIALNSVEDGRVWADHDGTLAYVGNWSDVQPRQEDEEPETTGSGRTVEERTCIEGGAEPPSAGDDSLGVRTRPTVFDVLHNDDDLNCEPIAVVQVFDIDPPWAGAVTIVDHGQHLLYTPSDRMVEEVQAGTLGSLNFRYVVADVGGNLSTEARVDVTVQEFAINQPPGLRPKGSGDTRLMSTVVEEGRAIVYDVTPDWWDPDGDELRLVSAVPEGLGEVSASPDGLVRYAANGVPPGTYRVRVTMTDGRAEWSELLEVTVLPIGTEIAPVTTNDFVTMVVGESVVIDPLANDIDPNENDLSLQALWSVEGLDTTVRDTAVEIVAIEPGVYGLDYKARDGSDGTDATIRVEVLRPAVDNEAPVAVPDEAKVRRGRVVNVDVLDNDIDRDGDLLSITSVEPLPCSACNGSVSATLVDRRMLQLEVRPGDDGSEPVGPFLVAYTVTDGFDQLRAAGRSADELADDVVVARGLLTVLVQPPTEDQAPIMESDTVTVRSGDVAAAPVLRNDLDPDADELVLVGVDADRALELEQDGSAIVWAQGRHVFVAGGEPGRYTILYTVDAGGRQASAELSIIVTAQPTDARPDQPPEPEDLELRAVRGGTVRLRVPLFGVDPDGDSVVLVENFGPPSEPGSTVRIDPENRGVILFTAGRNSGPRDSFWYEVEDPYGERARGRVTVAVIDDGGWPPQAHDDVLRGRPGRTLSIPVLANDVSPQDRALELEADTFFDEDGQPSARPRNGDAVRVLDQDDPTTRGRIAVDVPLEGTIVEHYRISDGLNPSDAFIRVTADPDTPNRPPVAEEDVVTVAEAGDLAEVTIDVLANDFDPDDATAPLLLSLPANSTARIEGGQLVVTRTEQSQIVVYRITDADDATATGLVRVPGLVNSPPELSDVGRDPSTRPVEAGGPSITLLIADLTTDPDGDTDIRLTPTELGQPAFGQVARIDDDGLGFTFTPPETLPATETVSVTFEVTDRPLLSDEERNQDSCRCRSLLTIELVIDASSPPVVLGAGAVSVPQFDEPVPYSLEPLTTDEQGDTLTYQLAPETFGGLTVTQDGPELVIESELGGDQTLPVGAEIVLRYTVSDGQFEVDNIVTVTITDTNQPPPAVALFDQLEAERGEPLELPNLLAPAFNPFPDQPLSFAGEPSVVGDATVSCGDGGDCTFTATTVGSYTVNYLIEDHVGRTAPGTIDVVVKGKPFAPGIPRIESVGDHVVTLSWDAADMQGGVFERYVVTAVETGATQEFQNTGGVFENLENAREYHFTVVAWNELGEGEVSAPSTGATPDRVPDPPVNLAFTDYQDEQLTLVWEPPPTADDFSAIVQYEIRIGGQTLSVGGGVTTLVVGAGGDGELSNGVDYSFEVRAQNSATTDGGWGAWSSPSATTERPSRQPDPPTNVAGVNSGDGGAPRITVTWDAPSNDGGRGLVEYRVCEQVTGGGSSCQTIDASSTQATFTNAGNVETSYTVIAINSDKNQPESDESAASAPVTSVRDPAVPTVNSVQSFDKRLVAAATSSNDSGCSNMAIEYSNNGGSSWQSSGEFTGLTNGTSYTIVARAVLGSECGTPGTTYQSVASPGVSSTPYGPLADPTIQGNDGSTVTWDWQTRRADDGRPGWRATLSGDCTNQTLPSGPGATGTSQRNVGNTGQTYTCTITVVADGQSPRTAQASAVAPPPPSMTFWRGDDVSDDQGRGTGENDDCNGTCYRVGVQLDNFPAGATIEFRCQRYMSSSFTNWASPHPSAVSTTDANGSFRGQSWCWHGFSVSQAIQVRVGGSSGVTLQATSGPF